MRDPVFLALENDPHIWVFWCAGCEQAHHVDDRRWSFNGDPVKPTVSPSILVHPHGTLKGGEFAMTPRCHSFIEEGQIRYLADCEHALAGRTVPLAPL